MASAAKPDLIIVGQVTIDDVVPAQPGAWTRQIGGSSLYALAGARLWLEPERIGLVARVGRDYPFDLAPLLAAAGTGHVALRPFDHEHLVEWLIYEPDGARRSLPRNRDLLGVGAEGTLGAGSYDDKLLQIAPTAEDIPADWLPVAAMHLCPQIGSRHPDTLKALAGRCGWISVDPSPHYSRQASVIEVALRLAGADALLPSEQEVEALLSTASAESAAAALQAAGFAEVAIKRGARPVVFADAEGVHQAAAAEVQAVDPTGAGDSFCGAYAACRLLGHPPAEAVRRAMATAAMVVGCSGVEAALKLERPDV